MSHVAVATFQPIWDCRWSRPGYRLINVEDNLQPEKLWVCVRTGDRRGVSEEECDRCPHWEALPIRNAVPE
jgi:hypothetical protein